MDKRTKKAKLRAKILLIILCLVSTYALGVKSYLYFQIENEHPALIASTHPSIIEYNDFITKAEANHLIQLAKERLKPSQVQVKGRSIKHPARTSSSAVLEKSHDKIVLAIEKKACELVGCQLDQIEGLQVVHYSKGQEYKPHYDFFPTEDLSRTKGQRLATIIVYLNTIDKKDGGATIFPKLGIAFQPKLGTAIYFKNLTEKDHPDHSTLHGGSPITGDNVEKWACNIWIREKTMTSHPRTKK